VQALMTLAPEAIEMARKRFTEYLVKSERDGERHEQVRHEAAGWDVPTLLNKAKLTKQGTSDALGLAAAGQGRVHSFPGPGG
jgi:hypothetical protein